jgi:DNA-binding NtrC family response regulator
VVNSTRLPRLLLVDDEDSVRVTLAEVLRLAGYDVQTMTSSAEALAHMAEQPQFDVIVADLHLEREADGLAVVRRAREQDPDVVTIILTGYVSMDTTVSALREGVTNFLAKPCNIDELKLAIERGLEKRRLIRELREAQLQAAAAAEAEQARRDMYALFMQAPAAIAVLRGPEHVYQLANPLYTQVFGRHREYIGRPAREVFEDVPKAEGERTWALLD